MVRDDNDKASHDMAPTMVTIKLQKLPFALASLAFCTLWTLILVVFGKGVELESFQETISMADALLGGMMILDQYNSHVATMTSALMVVLNWVTMSVLPAIFISLAPKSIMKVKSSSLVTAVTTLSSFGLTYLLTNSIGAMYVWFSTATIVPLIAADELSLQVNRMEINATNMTNHISELSNENLLMNTVLRNVITPIDFEYTALCTSDSPFVAAQVMLTYGFPMRSWQSQMLSSAIVADSYTVSLAIDTDDQDFHKANLPMNASLAANLFINALHMSRYFFRWYDNTSLPFNMTGLIEENYQPDKVASASDAPIHSVTASSLLKLLPIKDVSKQAQAEWFLRAAFAQFKSSLSGATNISQTESNLTFSHINISDGISFDAVTLEIPLKNNFYSRKLIQAAGASDLSVDTSATASNSSNTIFYDLDLTMDCGSNSGLCVMPNVQEYDVTGNEYQPEPQIKAIAVCLNDNGTEEFHIDYQYYSTSDGTIKSNVYWACPNQAQNSMWIVSLAVKIVGDALFDSAAPDDSTTTLESHRATIKNPRKVYALTVGRLNWETLDLAKEYSAECSKGEDKCIGLRFILESGSDRFAAEQHLILSYDKSPTDQLGRYAYNTTENTSSTTTISRWTPLVTLSTLPSVQNNHRIMKSDLLMSYNFRSFKWSKATRRATECSAAAESYLSFVVRNHFYMESGLQPAYTSAMYFLFKNGVVKDVLVLDDDTTTLAFDGNMVSMTFVVRIPSTSVLISLVGVFTLFIVSFVILVRASTHDYTRYGLYNKTTKSLPAEMVAQMMFDNEKYPPAFIECRLKTAEESHSIEKFKIDAFIVRHVEQDDLVALLKDTSLQGEIVSSLEANSLLLTGENTRHLPNSA